jgi:DNA-binding transcriptional MerR regulator
MRLVNLTLSALTEFRNQFSISEIAELLVGEGTQTRFFCVENQAFSKAHNQKNKNFLSEQQQQQQQKKKVQWETLAPNPKANLTSKARVV